MPQDTANILWGPVARLIALLAAGETFQTLVGARGDAAPKIVVTGPAAPDPAGNYYLDGTADGRTRYTTGDRAFILRWLTAADTWMIHLRDDAPLEPGAPRWLGNDDAAPAGTFYAQAPADGDVAVAAFDAAAAAAAHVFCPAIDAEDLPDARPFALVGGLMSAGGHRIGRGALTTGGELLLALEAPVPAEHAGQTTAGYAAAEAWFMALAGDILADILAATADGTALDVRAFALPEPVTRTDPKAIASEGDYYRAVLTIQWGAA